jgi:hypothetical protein
MKTPEQIVREATGMRPALSDWTGRKEQMAVAKAAMLEVLTVMLAMSDVYDYDIARLITEIKKS